MDKKLNVDSIRKTGNSTAPPLYSPLRGIGQQRPASLSSLPRSGSPPVYRPLAAAQPLNVRGIAPLRMGPSAQTPPVLQRHSAARRVVQRNCGTPGCTDPTCHDPSRHGFDRVFNLRGRTLYHGQINPTDIGTGTGTNPTTRQYVNSATTPYPQQVAIEYSTGPQGGSSEFINQPLAPGQRAQAGHIFGNQYGGYGNQPAAVFAQHPQTNMGNSHNGAPTFPLWRQHENQVRTLAESGSTVLNTVTLRDAERGSYARACSHCHRPNLPSATNCSSCGTLL